MGGFSFGEMIMDVKNFPLSELRPYERNPRRNDRAVDAVAKSIEQFGFKIPIVIDADKVIIAGHTRYKAAKKLRLESIPCVVAEDLTPEQVKAFRLVDNKTAELATWDFEKLGEELNSLASELVEEFSFTTPTQDESNEIAVEIQPTVPKQNSDYESVTFMFSREQLKIVEDALAAVNDEIQETFGNPNKKANAIYEIVRQWVEQLNAGMYRGEKISVSARHVMRE